MPTIEHAFVMAAYEDFLGRRPTADELAAAAVGLGRGGPKTAFLTELSTSSEWITAVLTRFYLDTLGRPPDAGGLAYWRGQLKSGKRSVADVGAQLYASDEYFRGFGGSNLEQWVRDLYSKILGRPADGKGLAHWVGVAKASGRGKVASAMYQSSESRRTRVRQLYSDLLHRGPDASGLAYWSGKVLTLGDLALARTLASSSEYQRRASARFPAYVRLTILPSGTFDRAEATGINNHGTAIGRMSIRGDVGSEQGFYQQGTGAPVLVPPLPGDTNTRLASINDQGIIAGCSFRPSGADRGTRIGIVVLFCHAFTYNTATKTATDLRPSLGATSTESQVVRVTAGGIAVGSTNGTPYTLDLATGARTNLPIPAGRTSCYVRDMSDAGVAVADCNDDAYVLDTRSRTSTRIPPLPGDQRTEAVGINESGLVLARSLTVDGSPRAMVFDLGTTKAKAGPAVIANAVSINEEGVVFGDSSNGPAHLWSSATGALVPLGGFGFGVPPNVLTISSLNDLRHLAGADPSSHQGILLR